MAPMPPRFGSIRRADFTVDGGNLVLRNDDSRPWRQPAVTLYTDIGFYRQSTHDMGPGETRILALDEFRERSGRPFDGSAPIKSLWIHAHDANNDPIDELAYPTDTFGALPAAQGRQTPLPDFEPRPGLHRD